MRFLGEKHIMQKFLASRGDAPKCGWSKLFAGVGTKCLVYNLLVEQGVTGVVVGSGEQIVHLYLMVLYHHGHDVTVGTEVEVGIEVIPKVRCIGFAVTVDGDVILIGHFGQGIPHMSKAAVFTTDVPSAPALFIGTFMGG